MTRPRAQYICRRTQSPAPATAMPCESSTAPSGPAAAPLVWRLASGVVAEPPVLAAAPTYEYEVRVTTEMPPSGSVDVSVAVTSFEEGDEPDLEVVAEASELSDAVGVEPSVAVVLAPEVVCVLSVVPVVVAGWAAARSVSAIFRYFPFLYREKEDWCHTWGSQMMKRVWSISQS